MVCRAAHFASVSISLHNVYAVELCLRRRHNDTAVVFPRVPLTALAAKKILFQNQILETI